MNVVVVGGSGQLGRRVVRELTARGEKVRVLVRDPDRARTVLPDGVDVVACDVRRRDGLDELIAGADVVVSAMHGFLGGRGAGPVEVDDRGNGNLVAAAAGSGADVVLVSVLGAAPDSPSDLFRAKHRAEQQLRSSGVPWTIVRPGAYLETWLEILTKTAGSSGRPLIFGRGQAPICFVSATDVAALVVRAAMDAALRGQVFEIAGEPCSMTELAGALQAAHGWDGSPRHLPRPLLRTLGIAARPINPAFARQNRMALAMDSGQIGPVAVAPVDPQLRRLSDVLADAQM